MTHKRLVIGIVSAARHAERRMRCRRMWTHALAGFPDVSWRFFVGADAADVDLADREPDTVVLPCPDDYLSLPQKTEGLIRWFQQRYDFDWLYKCDDDTFVRADRLLDYRPPGEYCGWSVSRSFAGSPDVASGGAGYVLSPRASRIAAEFLAGNPVGAEDDLVGRGLARAGVPLHHDPRFRWDARAGTTPAPGNDLISAHWVNTDEVERAVLRPWHRSVARHASPTDLVLRVGSRVIRWVIGPEHDRVFAERVLLPWALPDAEHLESTAPADFTVGVYLSSHEDVERVLDAPGLSFLLAGEPELRYAHGGEAYSFVQDARAGDGRHTRYAPMLCIWAPPTDPPPKSRACSAIEGKKRPDRLERVERLAERIGGVEGFGAGFGRPLAGYHCVGPDPWVSGKHAALAEFGFSVAIERVQAPDYLTEKFTDGVMCETVPIYRGCPNVREYAVPGSFVPFDEADRLDWKNWEREYAARRAAVVRQKELVRRYFNVLAYFAHLTGHLELLDRDRPITLDTLRDL